MEVTGLNLKFTFESLGSYKIAAFQVIASPIDPRNKLLEVKVEKHRTKVG